MTAEWKRRAVLIACALLITLPLAWKGASCGHDFDFHLQSWMAVVQQWHHGVLYPHWVEGANYSAGEPRLVFYPPFSWMLGALLGLVLPGPDVPIAYTFLVTTACALSMNKLARAWLPADAAALAACAYILNPYALFVAYERTAYGEFAAAIWLPLILLYALKAPASTNPGALQPAPTPLKAPAFEASIYLALSIAAIWLTNAPAAVMALYTVAVVTLWISIARRSWKPVLHSAAGLILGLGLASFYLIPAAYERRWVDIARAIGPGSRIQDNFLFSHFGGQYHDQVLHTASSIFVLMAAATVIFAAIAFSRGIRRFIPLLASAAVLLFLQLPSSRPIWDHAPELRFLQFPWRWSLVLSAVLALALASALHSTRSSAKQTRFPLQTALILIAALACVSAGIHLFWQFCDEEDIASAQLTLFHSGAGFAGTDEYQTLGADNSLIQQGLPQIRVLKDADSETAQHPAADDQDNPTYTPDPAARVPASVNIQNWQPEDKSATVTTTIPAFAILRLMDYPAWLVKINGAALTSRPRRDDGLVAVPLQPGTNQIEIHYATTSDVLYGRTISVISLLTLLGLAILTAIDREQENREDQMPPENALS